MRLFISLLLPLALIVLMIALGSQNADLITVNLFIARLSMPVASLMAFSALIGVVVALLVSGAWLLRLKWQNRQLRKQLSAKATDN